MDELEIDGKKYVSSRRAAKQNGYHTDYIGQLIRAGKIVGKKVGRAWYVDEKSLDAYLLSERAGGQPTRVAEELPVVAPAPAPAQPVAPVGEVVHVEEKIEPQIIEAPIVEEKAEQKIRITLPEKEIIQKKSTLTYIEDDEPFLPALEGRSRANADFISVPLHRRVLASEPQQEEYVEEVQAAEETYEERSPSIFKPSKISALVAVAIGALLMAGGGSVLVATSIEVREGQPASVVMTIK